MAVSRRHRILFIGLFLFISTSLITFSDTASILWGVPVGDAPFSAQGAGTSTVGHVGSSQNGLDPLPLPSAYQTVVESAADFSSGFCRDRFSTKLLDDFRNRRAQYCSAESTSRLTCFHTVNSGSFAAGSIDSFCIAQHGIAFDAKKQKFTLDCRARDLSDHEVAAGAIPLGKIQSYQYLTGPKFLLTEWTNLTEDYENPKTLPRSTTEPSGRGKPRAHDRNFVILLKREVDGNLWHCLNEFMAIMTTLDVLRMTPDASAGGTAMFLPEDVANTEIVILDEHPDGLFFDLFRMFSGKPPLRLTEWVTSKKSRGADDTKAPLVENLIIPYAGAANPLWTDWVRIPDDCGRNTMLQVFVQRIFDFHGIPRARLSQRPSAESRLNVTVILRKGSRKLMGLDSHLFAALQAKFSQVADVHLVDFAGMSFREQIEAARDTDVLVGMHGAGLTQAMFMEEGRGAVVEIQPDRLCHHGFRNLAKMTGQAYFLAGANKVVGNCYRPVRAGTGSGELEMMPDDGTALPSSWETSRCWSYTTNPDDWSFACSDPEVTGGEQSYMVCRNREASDEWYSTCSKKEASDMYWLTRYVMEQDRFLELVGKAVDTVRRKQKRR